jgi:hypothetical protein
MLYGNKSGRHAGCCNTGICFGVKNSVTENVKHIAIKQIYLSLNVSVFFKLKEQIPICHSFNSLKTDEHNFYLSA